MIRIPAHVNAHWIETLGDDQLAAAEAQLYADFRAHEATEQSRSSSQYKLLQGRAALVNAWQQWLLVSNEMEARGVLVRRVH